MPRGIPKPKTDVDPFTREQQAARKIYNELVKLDRPSRRRVLGIVNDYAMNAERYARSAPQEESGTPFSLDEEEE